MKIDKLIEKTTEKEGAKKWKVVVGIVVGVVLACGFFVGGYVVTEPIIDEYLLGYSESFILFNFYESVVDSDESRVYFIGNSNMATQIYVPEIDDIMEERGYDDISSYNLYVPSDSPRQRALQIDSIIQSKPSLVIYGISYSSLIHTTLYDEQILLSNEYINLDSNLSKLYTDEEIELMSPNRFYKRGYLLRSLLPADWDFTLTHFHPDNQVYVKEPFNPVWTEKVSQNKDLEEMYLSSLDVNNGWRPEITQDESLGKEVIRYTVNEFQDAGIPIIFINMPIHPYLSNQITDETRKNTFDFLDSTGVEWYDYEKLYSDSHFRDLIHVTYEGSLDFSREMADLIIQELS